MKIISILPLAMGAIILPLCGQVVGYREAVQPNSKIGVVLGMNRELAHFLAGVPDATLGDNVWIYYDVIVDVGGSDVVRGACILQIVDGRVASMKVIDGAALQRLLRRLPATYPQSGRMGRSQVKQAQ